MNIKKTMLTTLVLSFSILFVGCQTQENNKREKYANETKTIKSTVIINEDNNDSIKITNTPLTVKNEIYGFEVMLGNEWSGGFVNPFIRGYILDSSDGGHYSFTTNLGLDAITLHAWEKDKYIEEEYDLADPIDIKMWDYYNGSNVTKIRPKSGENKTVKFLGYENNTVHAVIGSNNKYYFSISYTPDYINNYFNNNTCMDVEINEYPYHGLYCPNAVNDVFEKIDFFDVK